MDVRTYDGAVSPNAYTLVFDYSGTSLNIPNWKLSAKLTGPIVSTDGSTVFPSEKISFIPTKITGQAQNPGPLPGISDIGMPSSVALNGQSEAFLVPVSHTPLYNVSQYTTYYRMEIHFDLSIAGGAYLEKLQGGDNQKRYNVPLEFTAYKGDGTVIGTFTSNYMIDVFKLSGMPPASQYSISVSTEALNGLLEFKNLSDYVNGKSVTYQNGLSVVSNTAFQVTARTVSDLFSSASGNTLPAGVCNVQIMDSSAGPSKSPVSFSTSPQLILDGVSTGGSTRKYDINYHSKLNDSRLIEAVPDKYSIALIYEIAPR